MVKITAKDTEGRQAATDGRLHARLSTAAPPGPHGLRQLGLDGKRDAWLYVPARYVVSHPAPLILSLHGAGGNGRGHLTHLRTYADELGIILLGPDSREQTWDVIIDGYGPDIQFIDRALRETFSNYAIDPHRIAIEGFSDGASYALSVGVTNGDLFTHILAFSPGFMVPAAQHVEPKIFISHGTRDTVLNIDRCSRRIVPQLEAAGYHVRYVEFDDGHTVAPKIARDAVTDFVDESI